MLRKFYVKYFSGMVPVFWLISILIIPLLNSCAPLQSESPPSSLPPPAPSPAQAYSYNIVNVYPHDTGAFTEGLEFNNGILFEGTGLKGKSSIRKVDLKTGRVLQINNLSEEYFGEGITLYGGKIIQLTWQSHTGFVYEQNNLKLLDEFSYPTEGWGIAHDDSRLIMSDGTSILRFWDPTTYSQIGQVEVRDQGLPVDNINELEYVRGSIYANIWKTDKIAIIEPRDGRISGWIDLSGLLATQNYHGPVDVLNGIAYDQPTDRLFVTGKLWPDLFEIKLTSK
jgi:glutaminyl-peptide cyclotransferase